MSLPLLFLSLIVLVSGQNGVYYISHASYSRVLGASNGQSASCGKVAEGNYFTLECVQAHQVITSIDYASYGNGDINCNTGMGSTGSCHSSLSTSFLTSRCLNQPSCTFQVTNGVIGGDPCENVVKNFAAKVTCTPKKHTLCGKAAEHTRFTLQCPTYQVVTSIDYASYGTGDINCNTGVGSPGSCHSSLSTSFLTATCIGKSTCSFMVDNTVIGEDPCGGSVKNFAAKITCSSENRVTLQEKNGKDNQKWIPIKTGNQVKLFNAAYGTILCLDEGSSLLTTVDVTATSPRFTQLTLEKTSPEANSRYVCTASPLTCLKASSATNVYTTWSYGDGWLFEPAE